MKKFKKLLAKVLLIAIALFGVSITSQSVRANCLLSITWENGDVGWISCGSSAGAYEARITSNGIETYDPTAGTLMICFLFC